MIISSVPANPTESDKADAGPDDDAEEMKARAERLLAGVLASVNNLRRRDIDVRWQECSKQDIETEHTFSAADFSVFESALDFKYALAQGFQLRRRRQYLVEVK